MISTCPINLRYSDTDQMGVIYHANYFTFYEQGRTKFLKDLGYDYHHIEEQGYLFPIREVHSEYLKAIRFGEKVYVKTRLKNLSKIKITYVHELYNEEGTLCASGVTSVVCVDKHTFTPTRIHKALPDIYHAYSEALSNTKEEDK